MKNGYGKKKSVGPPERHTEIHFRCYKVVSSPYFCLSERQENPKTIPIEQVKPNKTQTLNNNLLFTFLFLS